MNLSIVEQWLFSRRPTHHPLPKEGTLAEVEQFATELYEAVLRRPATATEVANVVAALRSGAENPFSLLHSFVASEEYRRLASGVQARFPTGHFYSPIVDPVSLNERSRQVLASPHDVPLDNIAAIDLNLVGQKRLLAEFAPSFVKIDFTEQPSQHRRYHYENPYFGRGDAMVLFAMIDRLRPARIVEIGAGFSTACILDTIDRCNLGEIRYTILEPEAERVLSLLRPADRERVTLLGDRVQDAPLAIFRELGAGDVLFVDSSHVAKTGSDVLFEVFEILPQLAPGVMIHFHDIFYPFEYPADWIFKENRSWNEAYFLRAFLMHNAGYSIRFFNAFIFWRERETVAQIAPEILKNPGCSLWIEKVAGGDHD